MLHRSQRANLLINSLDFGCRMGTDLCTACLRGGSQGEQLLDVFEREADLLGPLDEAYAPHSVFGVQLVICGAPRRPLDEPPPLIVPQRLDMHSSALGNLSTR